jgi:DNA-directed RNA polymerase subunit M/transcription elongation factor TFIIS
MIEVLIALYFSIGLILVLFGPAKLNIAREVEKVKNFKPSSRSNTRNITKNKIILFRLIITAGFIMLWPFFLSGVLKDNQRSVNVSLVNNLKSNFKGKKFNCPKCKKKEAVEILYGYPSPETLQAWHNNQIELGGCIVDKGMFNRKCINCNYQWETK